MNCDTLVHWLRIVLNSASDLRRSRSWRVETGEAELSGLAIQRSLVAFKGATSAGLWCGHQLVRGWG